MDKKYIVKVIHEFEVVAENKEQAITKAIEMPYSEARDCDFEAEEQN